MTPTTSILYSKWHQKPVRQCDVDAKQVRRCKKTSPGRTKAHSSRSSSRCERPAGESSSGRTAAMSADDETQGSIGGLLAGAYPCTPSLREVDFPMYPTKLARKISTSNECARIPCAVGRWRAPTSPGTVMQAHYSSNALASCFSFAGGGLSRPRFASFGPPIPKAPRGASLSLFGIDVSGCERY